TCRILRFRQHRASRRSPGSTTLLVQPSSQYGQLDVGGLERAPLIEEYPHQDARTAGWSRLRATNSITAFTWSRSSPSYHSMIWSKLAPASRFSNIAETGIRVPLSTQAPLNFPGMLSTAGQSAQFIADIESPPSRLTKPQGRGVETSLDAPRMSACATL